MSRNFLSSIAVDFHELVLMNFILPDLLADSLESLKAVFKARAIQVTLLAQERVSVRKK